MSNILLIKAVPGIFIRTIMAPKTIKTVTLNIDHHRKYLMCPVTYEVRFDNHY